jgi:3-oxoacyl-[acyl-carrier-protein] synthase-3
MALICRFGRYLPERVMGNEELASGLGCEASWIVQASGIEERRVAAEGETVADMAVAAARCCVTDRVGMLIVSSGSAERRFAGPAAEVAQRLGLAGIPAIDLPLASAGSLFAIALAARLAPGCGDVLVVASEKMAAFDRDRNIAILFGDGAGACLVSARGSGLEIVDSVLHSDGSWSAELSMDWNGELRMNGPTVIMQASRKVPAAINELLGRNGVAADSIRAFVMHQANQNLMDRVARSLRVSEDRFVSNIRKYGNTSSASMLIAASEWYEGATLQPGDAVCLTAFGAGFHWGALLCRYIH